MLNCFIVKVIVLIKNYYSGKKYMCVKTKDIQRFIIAKMAFEIKKKLKNNKGARLPQICQIKAK